jgi:hypothetical protein
MKTSVPSVPSVVAFYREMKSEDFCDRRDRLHRQPSGSEVDRAWAHGDLSSVIRETILPLCE